MTKSKPPVLDWSDITLKQQRAIIRWLRGDGHTIWNPNAMRDAGLDERVIKHFTQDFMSNTNDVKSTIFTADGTERVVRTLTGGVYGLNVIESLARHHSVTSDKGGRGFRASDLSSQLLAGPLRNV